MMSSVMALPQHNFQAASLIGEGLISARSFDNVKEWLEFVKFDDLPDEMVALFVLSCGDDIELTKRTIVAYFRCKLDAPEIFNERNIDNDDLKLAISTVKAASIPVRTKNNDVIHFFALHDTDYTNFHLIPILKLSYMVLDISQHTNPPNGLIVVIDAKGAGVMHMTRIKLNALRKYFQFLQEGFPIKLKVIHIINSASFVNKFISIIKVFTKTEILNMLKLYSPSMSLEELHKIIPPDHLPQEYGGTLPSIHKLNETTVDQFRELKEFFEAEENLKQLFIKTEKYL